MYFRLTNSADSNKQVKKHISQIISKINDNKTIILNYNNKLEKFSDVIIEKNYILINDKLKKIFTKYGVNIIENRIVLIDKKENIDNVYWAINLPILNCISEKSKIRKDFTIEKIIIDETKIEDQVIFKVPLTTKGNNIYSAKAIICDISFCESLLRRNVTGLNYEQIEAYRE